MAYCEWTDSSESSIYGSWHACGVGYTSDGYGHDISKWIRAQAMRTQHGTVGLIGIAEYLYVYVHDGNIYSLKNIFCRYIASFLFKTILNLKRRGKMPRSSYLTKIFNFSVACRRHQEKISKILLHCVEISTTTHKFIQKLNFINEKCKF